ncbi:hypothetical protein PSMK_22620 [Phycisphaera mikurensis NBRC 102666]|uniref:Response regulatory domain-containing protein n=1 Tax=Phycisphaera mikurensis (strain NBRC 102666 / KCTC 22515 / FYK2301M01) TaxID=1142394 RepID=I0IGN3_PHYMF|nr:hypothetical protein PSMK_22620 [Phycisphaera mikurensis NBRC 102666]
MLLAGEAAGLAGVLEALRVRGRGVEVVRSEDDAATREALAETAPGRRADLAVLDATTRSSGGAALAAEFAGRRCRRVVLLANSFDAAEAARLGLLDLIDPALPPAAASARLAGALDRVAADAAARALRSRERRRSRRLLDRCSALEARCAAVEADRKVIADQVETLCSDLVGAYQELADRIDAKMSAAVGSDADADAAAAAPPAARDLRDTLGDHLGLEPVIRSTLEHLVSAAGGTNAAIFLPASMDEFSLGGYVNHTCNDESAGMLLEHLADVVAPKLSCAAAPVHLTDNDQLAAWFGQDAAWLDDSEFIGVPCSLNPADAGGGAAEEDAECLAVVVLFRDGDQPFGAAALEACESLGPVLAAALHRVIRVHHRSGLATPDDLDARED